MSKKIKLSDGGCRFCLFLNDFTPSDEQIDALFEIDGVEEVGSEGYRDYQVVFYLESISELTAERVEKAKGEIIAALGQSLESAIADDTFPPQVKNSAVSK